ncbi:MAG: DNA polymerase IV [Halobacteriales archaeon]
MAGDEAAHPDGVTAGTAERLPGAPADSPDRIVLHVDMDCFYAACERLREPALEGEPVVVGMGYDAGEPHGAVATASYEAREYGVESAMAISEALTRLPRQADAADDPDVDPDEAGHYRPVDMDFYREVAEDVRAILHDVADTVREVSIDEAYLDVADRTDWPVAEGFARHVKERIDREVGVTASVGVAPNMSAAKVASDREKPDGLVVVRPGEVRDFLADLPIDELHGIGPVTAGELREAGIETVGDLADADAGWVEERYGERGRDLYRRARGEDDRPVEPVGQPKSLSRESSIADPTDDAEAKRDRIRRLAAAVADRARRKGALYRTIGIKFVEPPYEVHTRARTLPGPVDDPELVESVALELLREFEGATARKLGVRVSNLSFAEQAQADLDAWEGDGTAGGRDDPGEPADGGTATGTDAGEADPPRAGHGWRPTRPVQTTLSDFV